MQDPKEPNVVSFDEVVAQARRAHEFNDEWRKAVDKAMTENATIAIDSTRIAHTA